MRTKLILLLLFFAYGLTAQRINPDQIRKETGSDKQKVIMSDATTGVYSSTSDGMILPYDTQRGADLDYDNNDLVTYGGYIYRSQANNNVTTPGVGTWELITSAGAVDSTRLVQDSILVYYTSGSETGRDTIAGINGATESIGPTTVIRRVLTVGDTITASTPGSFLEWFTFAPPTMALTLSPTTTVYEVGTSNSIDLRVVTTNPASATLSSGTLTRTNPASNTVSTFTSNPGDTVAISFTPTQAGSGDYNQLAYSFQATQNYSGTESGSIASNTRSISGIYPVFYGMASTDTTAVKGDIYGTLNKLVQAEGDKTVSFTGSGLIYYAFPASWGDTNLSLIQDSNPFNVTPSFTRTTTTVTSTGLTNNYTSVSYVVYYLNTGSTTTAGDEYTFNQ